MAFNDFREPIEYVVDQYFRKKSFLNKNTTKGDVGLFVGGYEDSSLPEYPLTIVRGEDNRVDKIIYGDTEELRNITENGLEGSILIWQEEFIRDSKGVVQFIDTTYPDGTKARLELIRKQGKVIQIKVGD